VSQRFGWRVNRFLGVVPDSGVRMGFPTRLMGPFSVPFWKYRPQIQRLSGTNMTVARIPETAIRLSKVRPAASVALKNTRKTNGNAKCSSRAAAGRTGAGHASRFAKARRCYSVVSDELKSAVSFFGTPRVQLPAMRTQKVAQAHPRPAASDRRTAGSVEQAVSTRAEPARYARGLTRRARTPREHPPLTTRAAPGRKRLLSTSLAVTLRPTSSLHCESTGCRFESRPRRSPRTKGARIRLPLCARRASPKIPGVVAARSNDAGDPPLSAGDMRSDSRSRVTVWPSSS
jgi:hypothetical protein